MVSSVSSFSCLVVFPACLTDLKPAFFCPRPQSKRAAVSDLNLLTSLGKPSQVSPMFCASLFSQSWGLDRREKKLSSVFFFPILGRLYNIPAIEASRTWPHLRVTALLGASGVVGVGGPVVFEWLSLNPKWSWPKCTLAGSCLFFWGSC